MSCSLCFIVTVMITCVWPPGSARQQLYRRHSNLNRDVSAAYPRNVTDLPAYNSVGPDLDELTFLGDTELPGNPGQKRTKRAMPFATIGKSAVQLLFLGAKYVGRKRPRALYVKKGGYHTALKDFKSIKPESVHKVRLKSGVSAMEGSVGPLKIYLYRENNNAMIDVVDVKAVNHNVNTMGKYWSFFIDFIQSIKYIK